MAQIGGPSKKKLVAHHKPQVVIQLSASVNEFLLLGIDQKGVQTISWIGDPYAATKYESKYDAKNRTRHIADIPDTRTFLVLEQRKGVQS